MFAPIMIVIPIYILARQLGIVNTHTALVLPYSSFCSIPALAFFMAVQRHLVAGWGSGGLNG